MIIQTLAAFQNMSEMLLDKPDQTCNSVGKRKQAGWRRDQRAGVEKKCVCEQEVDFGKSVLFGKSFYI